MKACSFSVSLLRSMPAKARFQLRRCTSSRKWDNACSGVDALALNPGSAEPAAIPTVPLECAPTLRPMTIRTTVTATRAMMSGNARFILSSRDVVAFPSLQWNRRLEDSTVPPAGRQQKHQEHSEDAGADR